MPVITFDEHDAAHERRTRSEAVGRLISATRVAGSLLHARAGSDIGMWELACFLRDAVDTAERVLAPEVPPSGKVLAVLRFEQAADRDDTSTSPVDA